VADAGPLADVEKNPFEHNHPQVPSTQHLGCKHRVWTHLQICQNNECQHSYDDFIPLQCGRADEEEHGNNARRSLLLADMVKVSQTWTQRVWATFTAISFICKCGQHLGRTNKEEHGSGGRSSRALRRHGEDFGADHPENTGVRAGEGQHEERHAGEHQRGRAQRVTPRNHQH
jgi:hypothetical protein